VLLAACRRENVDIAKPRLALRVLAHAWSRFEAYARRQPVDLVIGPRLDGRPWNEMTSW